MAKLLKKKSLEEVAVDNTTVTLGTSKQQEVLKEGVPNDHHRKQENNSTVVGANVGVTLNMQDYNSLRVDVWLTDTVKEEETTEMAYSRVVATIDKVLQDTIQLYKED